MLGQKKDEGNAAKPGPVAAAKPAEDGTAKPAEGRDAKAGLRDGARRTAGRAAGHSAGARDFPPACRHSADLAPVR